MSKKKQRTTLEIEISPAFLIIFIVTIVLLVSLVVGLFVFMNRDKGPVIGSGNPGGGKTPSGEDLPVGDTVKTPLYPTVATRSSYRPVTSDSVVDISDSVAGYNAMLVKVTSDGIVSTHEKDADARIYPASITKVMTLIVACERVTDLSVELTATDAHQSYKVKYEGSGILRPGDTNTVEDLLYLINYQSDTIACLLIAEHIAGSEEEFVKLMNQKAAELGMSGTNFVNSTGLWVDGATNYSTCRDIATMMVYALDNTMAYKCISAYSGHKFMVDGDTYTYYTSWYSGKPKYNSLGFSDNPRLSTVTVIGGKTGYIDESGFTFATVAQSKTDPSVKYVNVMIGKPAGQGYNAELFMNDYKYIYNTYAK